MLAVKELTRQRHLPVAMDSADYRLQYMRCGILLAMVGVPHPNTPGHLIAYPNCNCLIPKTDCEICFGR